MLVFFLKQVNLQTLNIWEAVITPLNTLTLTCILVSYITPLH